MFLITVSVQKSLQKFSDLYISEKDFGTERRGWQRMIAKRVQESIHQDEVPESMNKIRRFKWNTYPVILEKKGIRKKKQETLFKPNGQNNSQYGLRSIYKYGGHGIFGQITITE